MDSDFAEVSILACPDCGRRWLRYFYEVEAFSHSGRWYLGAITPVQRVTLNVDGARKILEELGWYYYGGSYYGGRVGKTSGKILLSP